jgi:ArsR family transcriptional regulator, arsenate/arsenite/antimonite-responsive transcriptional repressor / arsenate reductase (thioredoxin)
MSSDVVHRAALHAALGDPARLAIIDTLTLSDASPSELGAALSMPSNLLAHHLRVLESGGLISRSQSEGDRRRSYLSLVPGVLSQLNPGGVRPVTRVVFVCSANSARSQLASALWRRASTVPAASGGLDPAERIDPRAVAVAARRNLPLRRRTPRHLDAVLSDGDFVITVCDNAHERLDRHADLHWSIPDPVPVGTDAAFDAAYDELARRVIDLAPRLSAAS